MRVLIQSVLAIGLLATTAHGKGILPRPPRPIDTARFDALLATVTAEPFADGKIERIRDVAGGRVYSFTAGQVVALLASFEFWVERLDALRSLPLVDQAAANAVLRYFSGAPATMQTEAQRIVARE